MNTNFMLILSDPDPTKAD